MKKAVYWTEERRAYLLLVLPALVIYWAVIAAPTVFSLVLSATNYNGGPLFSASRPFDFIGFGNYTRMIQDKFFWISLKNNMYIVLISVFGQIPLGFMFAYVLHRKLVKFDDFFQTIVYLPSIISTIVVGRLWQLFFSAYGPFTEFMQRFDPTWQNNLLIDPKLAIIPVLFVILWMYTGTYLIIFLANLQKIDPALIEAARIDGATEWQVLIKIILPALSGVIVTSSILAISGSLRSFGLLFALTGGNPARRTSVLALYMYDTAFLHSPRYGMANAISVVMVVLSLILIIIVNTVEKKFGGSED